jgi:proteic killer suppression protein
MRIRNIRHKGLRRLVETGSGSGLPSDTVPKIRIILTFLADMVVEEELRTLPVWKPHQLTGERKGTWSLHVTKNWRITFAIDQQEIEIIDLDYEDYH